MYSFYSKLSSKTANKQPSATTTATRTMPLSLWKPCGGGNGRMPNYAAPTVSSQTRSVIHATSSHRDIPRRHQITSPVTSPRVHICPRFRMYLKPYDVSSLLLLLFSNDHLEGTQDGIKNRSIAVTSSKQDNRLGICLVEHLLAYVPINEKALRINSFKLQCLVIR